MYDKQTKLIDLLNPHKEDLDRILIQNQNASRAPHKTRNPTLDLEELDCLRDGVF